MQEHNQHHQDFEVYRGNLVVGEFAFTPLPSLRYERRNFFARHNGFATRRASKVSFGAEGIRNLLSDFQTAEVRISALHLHHGGNKLCRGALRPRLCQAPCRHRAIGICSGPRLGGTARKSKVAAQSKSSFADSATTKGRRDRKTGDPTGPAGVRAFAFAAAPTTGARAPRTAQQLIARRRTARA
jgi:hypothetical protein